MPNFDVARLKPENYQQVQDFLYEVLRLSKIPGISVAMNVDGEALEVAAGINDADLDYSTTPYTRFASGCINKFMVAIVILELVNLGLIDIEKTISYYLPELSGRNGNIIKVKHLLCHTAGYQGENLADPDIVQDYTWQKFAFSFNQRQMLFEPGVVFDYSHSATVILGKIIEVVSQRKAMDMVREFIMDPLDIKFVKPMDSGASSYVSGHIFIPESIRYQKIIPDGWCEMWTISLGGPWITMQELTRIGIAIIEDPSIFSFTTKRLLLDRIVDLPGRFAGKNAEQPYFMFGLGCARFPNGNYGIRSNFSGQCCALHFDRESKMVIAVGINANAPYIRDLIIEKLWNAMFSEDAPIIPEFNPSPLINFEAEELIGTYHGSEHHSLDIILEDAHLVLRIGHNPAITHNTKVNLLTLAKDKHGHIAPARYSYPIPIGFFRDNISKIICLMVGDNAYKKIDKTSIKVSKVSAVDVQVLDVEY